MLILCLEILWQSQIMHATMDQFHILTIWRKKFQLNGFTSIHYSFRKFFLDRERVSMGIKLSRGPHEHLAGANYCHNYDVGSLMVFCLFMLQSTAVHCQAYKGHSDLHSV